MRISRTRCKGAMQAPLDNWTIEGRLRTSDAYNDKHWGTCVLCGRRHYDAPYSDDVQSHVVSSRVNDSVFQMIVAEAKRSGVHESVVVRKILVQNLPKVVDTNTV